MCKLAHLPDSYGQITYDYKELYKRAIKLNRTINQGTIMQAAAKAGYDCLVCDLLDIGQIKALDIVQSAIAANAGGHVIIVKKLLKIMDTDDYAAITSAMVDSFYDCTAINRAVIRAISNGQSNIAIIWLRLDFRHHIPDYLQRALKIGTHISTNSLIDLYEYYQLEIPESLVLFACDKGFVDIMNRLMKMKIPMQAMNYALDRAFSAGHVDMIEFLLNNGANINCGGLLYNAITANNVELVRLLVFYGINICDFDLSTACKTGNIDIVKILVGTGGEKAGVDSVKCLLNSCDRKNIELVRLMLDNGVDPHVSTDWPLRRACRVGSVAIVELLLQRGANIHAAGDAGLSVACEERNLEMIKLLLDNGADVHAKNEMALHTACRLGYTDVVTLLLQYGANIHVNPNIIMCANKYGHTDVVKLLLDAGMKPPANSTLL
jgi:ankyrin repeat protein